MYRRPRCPFLDCGQKAVLPHYQTMEMRSFRAHGSLTWIAVHLPLGGVLRMSPLAATLHATLVACAALFLGLRGKSQGVAGAIVYAAGSQVLWRMSGAPLPHMLGMYVVIIAASLAALRLGRRPPGLAVAYFLPLLPSAVITLTSLDDWNRTREVLAFNLAGPAALFAVLWLFYGRAAKLDLWKLVWIGLGPLAGTATAAFWFMRGLGEIEFRTESNFAASGGFGPNQVASALSLGIVLLIAVLWLQEGMGRRFWAWALPGFLTVQTLLTFSRSGIAMALGAVVAMGLFLLRAPRTRAVVVLFALVAYFAADRFLVPWLDSYTKGAFASRYTDPSFSKRDVIAQTDLQLFRENPILGVGPGMGTELRASLLGQKIAAHTEFTRLLAEHGLGGVVALLALAMVSVRMVAAAPAGASRAWSLGLILWVWLYFSVNAFRLVLPAAAILLALPVAGRRSSLRGRIPFRRA